MKRLLIIIALVPFAAFCQTPQLPRDGGRRSYADVVEVQGSAADLHNRALAWFARYYTDSKEVVQADAPERIIGKARLPVYRRGLHGGYVNYTVEISFKDGKYKYMINYFYHQNATGQDGWGALEKMYEPTSAFNRRTFDGFLEQTDAAMRDLVKSLTASMQSAHADW